MVEQQSSDTFEPGVRALYVRKLSRLSFQPIGELREALLGIHNEEVRDRLGQSALFLYTQTQVENFRPGSLDHRKSEQRDSNLKKRLANIATRQFDLAKWVGMVPSKDKTSTGFVFNVLFDTDTQMKLHKSVSDKLNQTMFGRPSVLATFWVPDSHVVSGSNEWHQAAQKIKKAAWGYDNADTASTLYAPPSDGGTARVSHIDWKSRIINSPKNEVA